MKNSIRVERAIKRMTQAQLAETYWGISSNDCRYRKREVCSLNSSQFEDCTCIR